MGNGGACEWNWRAQRKSAAQDAPQLTYCRVARRPPQHLVGGRGTYLGGGRDNALQGRWRERVGRAAHECHGLLGGGYDLGFVEGGLLHATSELPSRILLLTDARLGAANTE